MRGQVNRQESLFVVISLEQRVPRDHPLRPIKRRCDELLAQMNRQFQRAYSHLGRPSIPPEQLLKALLLQALYSIRSEIALMNGIDKDVIRQWMGHKSFQMIDEVYTHFLDDYRKQQMRKLRIDLPEDCKPTPVSPIIPTPSSSYLSSRSRH